VVGLVLVGVVGGAAAFQLHLLKPYQEQRFTAFTAPTSVSSPIGYQLHWSIIAIGSGGVTGNGFLAATRPTAGSSWSSKLTSCSPWSGRKAGLWPAPGSWRYSRWCACGGYGSPHEPLTHSPGVLAASLVSWFAFQSFVNIGMTVGLMPVTGVPLPFLSYGGSAIFAELVGVGLLVSIGRDTARSAT